MEYIKLSIIIPVYNVENYLRECIDSIIAQKLHSFEIILVDDGSTDNSGKICDEYSQKYSNLRTVHKENGGLSSARNCGIDCAKGEYLMFIDSDDFINSEIDLNELYKYMKYDVIQYKMLYYYNDTGKKVYLKDFTLYNDEDIVTQLKNKVISDELSVSACNKLVRKELIIENNVYFEPELLSEDIDWSLKLYLYAKSLYTVNLNVYVYRQNRIGSITNTASNKSIISLFSIIKKWMNYSYPSIEIKDIYLNYLAYQYVILITIINRKNCDKTLKEKVLSCKSILNYSENYKVKKSNKLVKLIGINATTKVLKLYLLLKNKGILKL